METYSGLKISRITTTQELRSISDAWDDLWQRSDVCFPRAKAYPLALWVDNFASENNFEAIIIEQANGNFLAALPLITYPYRTFFKMRCLASSFVVAGGEFLLDLNSDTKSILDLLVNYLANSSFDLLCFDEVAYNETRWQKFLSATKRAHLLAEVKMQHRVGQVSIRDDWASYEQDLSIKHRQNRRRQARLLEKKGKTSLIIKTDIQPSEVKELLLYGFKAEDSSWKGKMGTSVLKSPGIFKFICEEAAYLAKQGHLELVFLIHDNEPIAFIYGLHSKGIHYTTKVGYDEAYKQFGPGHQVVMRFLQYLQNLPDNQLLDFNGPLAPWSQSWSTNTYPVGRIMFTTNKFQSRLLFQIKQKWGSLKSKFIKI